MANDDDPADDGVKETVGAESGHPAPDTGSGDKADDAGNGDGGGGGTGGGGNGNAGQGGKGTIDLEGEAVVNAANQPPVDLDRGIAPASLPETVREQDTVTFTDHARRNIAYWLLSILSAIILLAFVLLLWALKSGNGTTDKNFEHIGALLNIVFGPVATLVGSAVGFY